MGLYGEGGGGYGFQGTAHPSHAPALPAPSPALCQMETSRRMFMETVNGLAAPSEQGTAVTRPPARRLQADPWLKIIQSSGCENLNKQDWSWWQALLQRSPLLVPPTPRPPARVSRPCFGYPALAGNVGGPGVSLGESRPQCPRPGPSPLPSSLLTGLAQTVLQACANAFSPPECLSLLSVNLSLVLQGPGQILLFSRCCL